MANTPFFTLRLPQELQDQIKVMGKAYGSSSPRAFCRELLETVLSGDVAKMTAFNVRLVERVTGQLQLGMEQDLELILQRKKQSTPSTLIKKRKKRRRSKMRHD